MAPSDLRSALVTAAGQLGVSPLDLGTVVSYETGGTFDPWQRGPTTKWGTHRGLIQFGEPQAQKYGAFEGQSAADQLTGPVVSYLRDAGVQPGMGLLDLYSAVNAGRVGRYDASDAAAGGAPGTVRDKVEMQMDGHRAKAAAILGDGAAPSTASGTGSAAPSAPPAPFGLAPPSPSPGDGGASAPASPQPDDSADFTRLVAQLTGPSSQAGASQAAPLPAAPAAPPLRAQPFDAARFFALLPRR
ncbi:hypothetical protein [Methylobacterium sp. JK268]